MYCRAAFQPDGLPDASGVRVPLLYLLAERRIGVARVPDADGERHGHAGACVAREVYLERRVAALMLGRKTPVDPDARAPIDSAEAEIRAQPAPVGRHLDGALVPGRAL